MWRLGKVVVFLFYLYKNLKSKISKCCASIYCNKQWLKHNLTPNYSKIRTPQTSPSATHTRQKTDVALEGCIIYKLLLMVAFLNTISAYLYLTFPCHETKYLTRKGNLICYHIIKLLLPHQCKYVSPLFQSTRTYMKLICMIFTIISVQAALIWVLTPYSLVGMCWRFRRIFWL